MKVDCCVSYANLNFRSDKGARTRFRVFVGTLTVDCVLATCGKGNKQMLAE